MPKTNRSSTRSVKEPVQVYLAADDSDLLARLVEETGLSKAEILRRGLRSFAREHSVASPMLRFAKDADSKGWRGDIAKSHDQVLAEAYGRRRRKGRGEGGLRRQRSSR
jgi:hypothetical protein